MNTLKLEEVTALIKKSIINIKDKALLILSIINVYWDDEFAEMKQSSIKLAIINIFIKRR